jgi:hypothetical protein
MNITYKLSYLLSKVIGHTIYHLNISKFLVWTKLWLTAPINIDQCHSQGQGHTDSYYTYCTMKQFGLIWPGVSLTEKEILTPGFARMVYFMQNVFQVFLTCISARSAPETSRWPIMASIEGTEASTGQRTLEKVPPHAKEQDPYSIGHCTQLGASMVSISWSTQGLLDHSHPQPVRALAPGVQRLQDIHLWEKVWSVWGKSKFLPSQNPC